MRFFWRFVRITLLTLLCGAFVVGVPSALAGAFANRVNERMTGWPAMRLVAAAWLLVLLLTALLRLYFDLVEAYTVLLHDQLRPDGSPDRRVRRTLLPALRTMFRNLLRAYGSFLLLTLLGLLSFALPARVALHTLAQPRVWPMFLLTQAGLLLMLFFRFWQRGAAMSLALQNPLSVPQRANPYVAPPPVVEPIATVQSITDPLPEPEPISPSLPGPDPGVFKPQEPTAEKITPLPYTD